MKKAELASEAVALLSGRAFNPDKILTGADAEVQTEIASLRQAEKDRNKPSINRMFFQNFNTLGAAIGLKEARALFYANGARSPEQKNAVCVAELKRLGMPFFGDAGQTPPPAVESPQPAKAEASQPVATAPTAPVDFSTLSLDAQVAARNTGKFVDPELAALEAQIKATKPGLTRECL